MTSAGTSDKAWTLALSSMSVDGWAHRYAKTFPGKENPSGSVWKKINASSVISCDYQLF